MGAKCTSANPDGFPGDWVALVNAAAASNVCNQPGDKAIAGTRQLQTGRAVTI
jgi:hypothetical protein